MGFYDYDNPEEECRVYSELNGFCFFTTTSKDEAVEILTEVPIDIMYTLHEVNGGLDIDVEIFDTITSYGCLVDGEVEEAVPEHSFFSVKNVYEHICSWGFKDVLIYRALLGLDIFGENTSLIKDYLDSSAFSGDLSMYKAAASTEELFDLDLFRHIRQDHSTDDDFVIFKFRPKNETLLEWTIPKKKYYFCPHFVDYRGVSIKSSMIRKGLYDKMFKSGLDFDFLSEYLYPENRTVIKKIA